MTATQLTMAIIAWSIHGLFALVGVVLALTVFLGLPGAWLVIALATIIELFDGFWLPASRSVSFGWWPIIIAVGLASLGELAELLAGAVGARRAGSTRSGAVGAIIGGLTGAIIGIPVPPPVIGSLVCSVLGTFIGAVLGELSAGGDEARFGDTMRPATGATIGRVMGTLVKVPVAAAVWALLVSVGLVRLLA